MPTPGASGAAPASGALVYQGFWASGIEQDVESSGWRAGPSWRAGYGTLFTTNSMIPPLGAIASPDLPPQALALVKSHDYTVEAVMRQVGTPSQPSAYGIIIRQGEHGFWRAGIVDGRLFIIGEGLVRTGLPDLAPAELLLTKAIATANVTLPSPELSLRFEARGHHYLLAVNGQRMLDVDDARYDDGEGIGVWADRALVQVTDFRLYAP